MKKFGVCLCALALTVVCAAVVSAMGIRVGVPFPNGKVAPAYLFLPSRPSSVPLPGVLVGVGVGSHLIPQYHDHCIHLAERGFAVLLLDPSNYPENLVPGPYEWDRGMGYVKGSINQAAVTAKLAFGHDWYVKGMKAGLDYLCAMPQVDRSRLVVSGFSQPANAALTLATQDPRIQAVVWNYGGSPWVMPYNALRMPPVCIFHGDKDDVYDVKYARNLAFELHTHAREYELHIYPGEKHMFSVYYDLYKENRFMKPVIQDSFEKMICFLYRTLRYTPMPLNPKPMRRAAGRG